MNFSLQKLSENFILNKLKLIKNGSLNLTNYNHEKFIFGETNKEVKADIKVNDPKFYFNILKGGSTGLAESYVRDDFSTSVFINGESLICTENVTYGNTVINARTIFASLISDNATALGSSVSI